MNGCSCKGNVASGEVMGRNGVYHGIIADDSHPWKSEYLLRRAVALGVSCLFIQAHFSLKCRPRHLRHPAKPESEAIFSRQQVSLHKFPVARRSLREMVWRQRLVFSWKKISRRNTLKTAYFLLPFVAAIHIHKRGQV
jgi:hypothetical protein